MVHLKIKSGPLKNGNSSTQHLGFTSWDDESLGSLERPEFRVCTTKEFTLFFWQYFVDANVEV